MHQKDSSKGTLAMAILASTEQCQPNDRLVPHNRLAPNYRLALIGPPMDMSWERVAGGWLVGVPRVVPQKMMTANRKTSHAGNNKKSLFNQANQSAIHSSKRSCKLQL